MKKWSYWASAHPQKARWLIALAASLLIFLGIEMGFGLAAWDIEIPGGILAATVGTLVLSMLLFTQKTTYITSRRFHFAVYASTFMVAIVLGNFSIYEVEKMPEQATSIQAPSLIHKVNQKGPALAKNPKNVFTLGLFQLKQLKKHTKTLKGRVKDLKKRYRDLPRGLAFFLFLLAAFGAFWLTYILVALACAFACSEIPALAVLFVLLAIGSFAGMLFLLGYAFYRLFENPNRGPQRAPREPRPVPNKSPKG